MTILVRFYVKYSKRIFKADNNNHSKIAKCHGNGFFTSWVVLLIITTTTWSMLVTYIFTILWFTLLTKLLWIQYFEPYRFKSLCSCLFQCPLLKISQNFSSQPNSLDIICNTRSFDKIFKISNSEVYFISIYQKFENITYVQI